MPESTIYNTKKGNTVVILSLLFFLFFIPFISAGNFPIEVTPLNASSDLTPNTAYTFTFNFSTNAACTSIVHSNESISITTDKYGRGFVNLALPDTFSTVPTHLCEYRSGSLRATHELSQQVFGTLHSSQNITADFFIGDGSLLTGIASGGADGNASSICSGDQVLLGNGSCQDSADFFDDTDTTIPDTNETVRFEELVSLACGAGDYIERVHTNGSIVCSTPAGGSAGLIDTLGPYLLDNGSQVDFNETKLNLTISQLDTDTTIPDTNESFRADIFFSAACPSGEFINGTTANGTIVCDSPASIADSNETVRFENLVELDCPAGQVMDGVYPNGTVVCVADADTDTTYTNGTGLNLTTTTFAITVTYALPQTCNNNSVAKYNNDSNFWFCDTDDTGAAFPGFTNVAFVNESNTFTRVNEFTGLLVSENITHTGDDDTYFSFTDNTGDFYSGGVKTLSMHNVLFQVDAPVQFLDYLSCDADNEKLETDGSGLFSCGVAQTDTNESFRADIFYNSVCPNGQFMNGTTSNGTIICDAPAGGAGGADGNASSICAAGEYLDGDGTCINFNSTVDNRDADTTYSAGTELDLTGTTFSVEPDLNVTNITAARINIGNVSHYWDDNGSCVNQYVGGTLAGSICYA